MVNRVRLVLLTPSVNQTLRQIARLHRLSLIELIQCHGSVYNVLRDYGYEDLAQ